MKKPFLIFFLLFLSIKVFCQSNYSMQKVVPDDRSENDNFGWSVDVFNDLAIVGTSQKRKKVSNTLLPEVGAVYLVKKNKSGMWMQYQKIESDNIKASNYFGSDLSIHERYAVIGAWGEDNSISSDFMIRMGAAYIYKIDSNYRFKQIQKLELKDGKERNAFGYSVCVFDKLIAIGAPGKTFEKKGKAEGAVYIYVLQKTGGWKQTNVILPPNESIVRFGSRLKLYDSTLVVACDRSEVVYVYQLEKNNSWELAATLKASNSNDSGFGQSVSIFKTYLVIGAQGDYDNYEGRERPNTDSIMEFLKQSKNGQFEFLFIPNDRRIRDSLKIKPSEFRKNAKPIETKAMRKNRMAGSGAVYFYIKNNKGSWEFKQRVVSDDIQSEDHFGISVDVSDSLMIVGAFGTKFNSNSHKDNSYAGSAYLFKIKNGTWSQIKKFEANPQSPWDKYGFSVGISGNAVIVGSRFEKENAKEEKPLDGAGAVYIYNLK